MTPRCRFLASLPALLPACLAAHGATAQEPTRALRDAKALVAALAQRDALAVAWAAHDARRLGDTALIVPLQRALAAPRDPADPHAPFVGVFVLDALAGLGAKLPAELLLPWLDDERAGPVAFLLLARESRLHEQELFALFRAGWPPSAAHDERESALVQHPALRLQAIGNLLCAQRAPGFAALLLRHADLDLRVRVTTPGARVAPRSTAWMALFEAPPPLPDGLPPLPVHTYVRTDAPGRTAGEWLAPGPIGIAIARREETAPVPLARSASASGARGLAAPLPWLQAMAGDLPPPVTLVVVPFTGAEACRRQIERARDDLRAYRSRLLDGLVAAHALAVADAERLGRQEVRVSVSDEREDRDVPLPELRPAK